MGAEIDYGRKRPNGQKIRDLRKERGIKQERLSEKARISVRTLRDIERKNHPVPGTAITAIAAVLEVNPGDITLSTPDASPTKAGSLLKLRAIRSATELSALAEGAAKYRWGLKIDPSTAGAADLQAAMKIVKRLVVGFRKAMHEFDADQGEPDEFDAEEFGEIPRLARLQDLLSGLRTQGVNVVAGTYTFSWLDAPERDEIHFDPIWVRVPGKAKLWIFETELILLIHFVPSDVEEEVIRVSTGRSLEELERVADEEIHPQIDHDKIPF